MNRLSCHVVSLLVIVVVGAMFGVARADPPGPIASAGWPAWRGPLANGVALDGQDPPVTWSDSQNVIWKTPVPGRGHSSPTVVGDRLLLSTADESAQTQMVLCFDRKTGRQLWQTVVNRGGLPVEIHKKNTHASPTVASNGKLVFAIFNNHDHVQLAALDLTGKIVWQKQAGPYQPKKFKFGYAPSPLLYRDLVIAVSDFDGPGFLAAFDQASGKEVWRIARPKGVSFSSPIVAHIAGRDQLLISGMDQVISYDPATGRQLWAANAIAPATCGTIVWDGSLVFASGGYPKQETAAIKADGSGEVIWRNNQKSYEQSMLTHDGYLYAVTDAGVAYCWHAATGRVMWRARLGGMYSASPTLANGRIYVSNERGSTFVFAANPQRFELLATNQLGDDAFASPAIVDSRIYLRVAHNRGGARQEMLYCLGK